VRKRNGVRPVTDPVTIVQQSYERDVTDEFIEPVALAGRPRLEHGDTAIFFNFRPGPGAAALAAPASRRFDLTTMTRYRDDLDCPVVFEEQDVTTRWPRCSRSRRAPAPRRRDGEVRARDVLLQRRPRGRVEGETRILVPSPRDVADVRPKAGDVGRRGRRRFAGEIGNGYRFGIVNFANPDMVGHTGVIPAAWRRSRRWIPRSDRSSRRSTAPSGVCLDHRRPR
jgi:2,3-bisphosphoglycerate-independent phosphoglycerate mutase